MISRDRILTEWAISTGILQEIALAYDVYINTGKTTGFSNNNLPLFPGRPPIFEMISDSTAQINIHGTISKQLDPLMLSLGAVSTINIAKHFLQSLRTHHITEIVFNIDSHGGQVPGTQSLANLIYENRDLKPIYAICDGEMLSAGYWIGAAAEKIFIASETTEVGSIGVLSQIRQSKKENPDYQVTDVTTRKYKAANSPDKEDNADLRQYRIALMEKTHEAFVNDIIKFRGFLPETDGRIFKGTEAIKVGLADGFYSLSQFHLYGKIVEVKK